MKTSNSPEGRPSDTDTGVITPRQAAARLGYKDVKCFLRMARTTGLRIIEINARVLRVDVKELLAWQTSLTV